MMETWFTSNFTVTAGAIVVYTADNGAITTFDPTDPTGLFSSIASTPPTYAELSALPCASQGWQKIFDQWKANGLVS